HFNTSAICRVASCVLATAILSGCASSSVTGHQRYVYDKLPRPGKIVVYSFAASAADVPGDSAFAGQAYASSVVPTSEEIQLGRELGDQIAARLVSNIEEMGLPASHGIPGGPLQVHDIVIRGYLASIEQGSTVKRMTIGFGSGGSEMTTVVE